MDRFGRPGWSEKQRRSGSRSDVVQPKFSVYPCILPSRHGVDWEVLLPGRVDDHDHPRFQNWKRGDLQHVDGTRHSRFGQEKAYRRECEVTGTPSRVYLNQPTRHALPGSGDALRHPNPNSALISQS